MARTIVHADHFIAVTNAIPLGACGTYDSRDDELVRLTAIIRVPDGGKWIRCNGTSALDRGAVEKFGALPPAIAVHSVVATPDCGNPRAIADHRKQFLHVTESAAGHRVATVHERVDEHAGHSLASSKLDERVQVLVDRVHSTRAYEAHEVQRRPTLPCALAGAPERRVLEEGAVGDRLRDPDEVLYHDATGAKVQVPHLAIAHLPVGETHCQARGVKQRP
jgi:hypothetical protein